MYVYVYIYIYMCVCTSGVGVGQKCTNKSIWRQGIVLKHRNFLQKSLRMPCRYMPLLMWRWRRRPDERMQRTRDVPRLRCVRTWPRAGPSTANFKTKNLSLSLSPSLSIYIYIYYIYYNIYIYIYTHTYTYIYIYIHTYTLTWTNIILLYLNLIWYNIRPILKPRISKFGVWVKQILKRRWICLVHRLIS